MKLQELLSTIKNIPYFLDKQGLKDFDFKENVVEWLNEWSNIYDNEKEKYWKLIGGSFLSVDGGIVTKIEDDEEITVSDDTYFLEYLDPIEGGSGCDECSGCVSFERELKE
jgi:hypothetical protein